MRPSAFEIDLLRDGDDIACLDFEPRCFDAIPQAFREIHAGNDLGDMLHRN